MIDLINIPLVKFLSRTLFAEPFYLLISVLTSTYVALYSFIIDPVTAFLVYFFLFSPFHTWVISRIENVVIVIVFFYYSKGVEYLIDVFSEPAVHI